MNRVNIYDILNLISIFITLYLVIDLTTSNPNNKVSRAFSYFSLALVGWNISVFYLHHVESKIVYYIIVVFLFSLAPSLLNFIYKLTDRPMDKILIFTKILYIIIVVLAIFTKTIFKEWRITNYGIDIVPGTLFTPYIIISTILPSLYGIYLLIDYRNKIKNSITKKALDIVLIGIFVGIFLIIFLDFFLIGLLNLTWVPSFASFSFIPSLFLYVAVKKYNIFILKPQTILPYLFNYLGEGTLILDINGKIVDANPAFYRLTREKEDNIIGKYIKNFISEFDFSKERAEYEKIWKDKVFKISQTMIKNREISIGYIILLYDITNYIEMGKKLKEAKEEAYQAMEAEARFLSNMSHEMRTPLNGIIITLELLDQVDLGDEEREYVSILKTQADALLEIINEILDLAKIKQGKFHLLEKVFDIEALFYDIVDILANNIYKKGLDFYPYIDPKIPRFLIGDPIKIKEIMINFLGNAVKFTDSGAVWIKILKEKIKDDRITLRIIVKDTGIGIPKDKIDEIFKEFVQIDNSSTKTYKGTGLGLAISKKIIESMGGEISIESKPQKGTTFSFTLNLKIEKGSVEIGEKPSKSFKVVIVSKNKNTISFLKEILKDWKIESISTYEEIEQITEEEGIILYEILDEESILSGKNIQNKKTTIIILPPTLSVKVKNLRESYTYIIKPIKQKELFYKLFKKEQKALKKEKSKENRKRFSKNYKILLVDDNQINQRLEGISLKKMGLSFDIANNGEEAVKLFLKNRYDLILMDIQMPIIDGIDATKKIREIEKDRGGYIPIIALTASTFTDEIKKFKEAGMDGYVAKPLKHEDLYREIEKFLKTNKETIFSPENLVEDLGSEDMVKLLLESNLEIIENLIKEFKNAKKENDLEKLAKVLHKIKGSIGNFTKDEFAKKVIELEDIIKRKGSYSNTSTYIDQIDEELSYLLKDINKFIKEKSK